MARAKNQYVDNQAFLHALIQYKQQVLFAQVLGEKKPKLPDYIGECILKIAEHLSYKPNFLNYPFREEMVGDGIENCLLYLDNFDPVRFKNPFAYFTQIMWFAFLRRIWKEKKQLYVKYKYIQNTSEFSEYVNQAHDEKVYDNTYIDFLRKNMGEIITEFEGKKTAKKRKPKLQGLERFFGGDEEDFEEMSVPIPDIEAMLLDEVVHG